MKTLRTILPIVSAVGLVVALLARIVFIETHQVPWGTVALYGLAAFSVAFIARLLIVLITDEDTARGFTAIVIFLLFFVFDFTMGKLLPELWGTSNGRLSRVIGLYFLTVVVFGGAVKLMCMFHALLKPIPPKTGQPVKTN